MFFSNNIYKFKNFSKYQNILQGVTTRSFGDFKKGGKFNQENIGKLAKLIKVDSENLIFMNQMHGSDVSFIKNREKRIIDSDGLITDKRGILLCVVTADCLPVLFYDKKKGLVGVCHAGYKGILGNITHNMIDIFQEYGSNISDILVGVGPGICFSCYQVSEDRVKLFEENFKYESIIKKSDGKFCLNLKKILRLNLLSDGISRKNIEISRFCTKQEPNKFYSFRREGENVGEFVSFIGIRN